MLLELVLSKSSVDNTKALGENVFLDALAGAYPVYIFYYPAETSSQALEDALRNLGIRTGGNLYINMGSLNDPSFGKIVRYFGINSFPTVVVTATAELAAPPDDDINSYIRVSGRLLADPNRAMEHIEQLYLMFLRGDIKKAVARARHVGVTEIARRIGTALTGAMKSFGQFLSERDVIVSVLEGRLELKRSSEG